MTDCLICAKHRGSGPLGGLRVWQDALVVVFHAPGPALGHLFVETLRHAPYLPDLTDDEAAAVGRTAARLARALRAEPGVALVHSAVAGLAIPHFHQHVLVRTEGTPRDVPWHVSDDWDGALRGDDADIAALCARLRTALESPILSVAPASFPGVVAPRSPQLSFDELGTPLREVTFVVLDLETTGGAPSTDAITEVGAVKVRGGEQVAELATLVDPGTGVPPHIVALTGITTAMIADAPRLPEVLPTILEFLRGAVLVAHNAPFDAGFLRAACERHGQAWPKPPVLCTARLARAVLSRDEAPSVRLGALARLFGTATTPNHRALSDARATVEVLHHLMERVGNLGVQSLEELLGLARESAPHRPTQGQRQKRRLAEHVPSAPGVYLFRGPRDEVLYVGTSGDLRRRVRSYFTAGERRRRVRDMVALAERVDTVVCAHALEASVRELRLIAAHQPRYNRRSRRPHRAWWITPTAEAFPRLSVVATPREGAFGPFRSRQAAVAAVETVLDVVPVRPCTQRIPARGASAAPCALHEMNRCAAPCAGLQTPEQYAPAVAAAAALVTGADDAPLRRLAAEIDGFSDQQRYETAAQHRDRLAALVLALGRAQRLAALAAVPELVGARPDGRGGWEVAVVRFGRLAAAGVARRGVSPMPVIDALRLGAQTILPEPGPLQGAPAEEVGLLHRWLSGGGTRLVHSDPPWAEPARGAGSWAGWAARARPIEVEVD